MKSLYKPLNTSLFSKYITSVTLTLLSFAASASLQISPTQVGMLSNTTCSTGATYVQNHLNLIKNNMTVSASEPSTNALRLTVNYPPNSNNSNYSGRVLMYDASDSSIASNSYLSLSNSGGSRFVTESNIPDGSYFVVFAIRSKANTSHYCIIKSNSFNVQQAPQQSDLIISNFNPSKNIFYVGETITLNATAKNIGQGSSPNTTLRYKVSNNPINSNSPDYGTDYVGSLSPNSTSNQTISFSSANPVTGYFGACIDTVPDESNTTNNCSSSHQFTVIEAVPDLQIPTFNIAPNTIVSGESISMDAIVKNTGNGNSTQQTLTYLASGNSFIDISDTSLGTDIVSPLSPNQTSPESYSRSMNIAPSNIYIGGCVSVDPNEQNQSNNCSVARPLTVKANRPSVSPGSGTVGQNFTFTANLGASLVSGYSYYLNFDDRNGGWLSQYDPGGHVPINCSGTSCSVTTSINEDGAPRYVRMGMFKNSNNALMGAYSDSRSFTVSQDTIPNVTVNSGPSVSGNKIIANINSTDNSDVSKVSFVIFNSGGNNSLDIETTVSVNSPNSYYTQASNSWGYDTSGTSVNSNWDIDISGLPNGNYDIMFNASDDHNPVQVGNSGRLPFTKTDAIPVVTVNTGPINTSNTLTANVTSTDDHLVTKVSFVVFNSGGNNSIDIENTVSVTSPNSYYSQSADSWGYDTYSSNVSSNWVIDVSGLPHGDYDIMFNASDNHSPNVQVGNSSRLPFTVSDAEPVVTVNTSPSVSNNILTASVNSTDNNTVSKVSFTVFDAGSSTSRNTQNEIVVNAPPSYYNPDPSANSWGYDTSSASVNSDWEIDISGLPEGNYEIEFNALDNLAQIGHSPAKYSFTKLPANIPNFVNAAYVTSTPDGSTYPLDFQIDLDGPLPTNYALFLNFDDLQGDWFEITDPGGHFPVTDTLNNHFSYQTDLAKPGLRYFRFGIFNTLGDNDPTNDILIGNYSAHGICTEEYCLNATVKDRGYGNPSITRSGSQLFKNVDVASGNFHLSTVDLSVPGIGPSFAFSRAYNSRAEQQWTFGYEARAHFVQGVQQKSGRNQEYDRKIEIGPLEDGRILDFFKNIDFDNVSNDNQWFALNQGNFNKLIENTDGSFTLYTQGNRIYNFADPNSTQSGHLINIKDRLNNTLTFQYNAGNYLTGITDANSRSYIVLRDGSNRISRITDFDGRYVEYTYDANGMLKTVQDPNGNTTEYFYTFNTVLPLSYAPASDYRLWKLNNALGQRQFTLTYDDKGQVTNVLDGVNDATGFTYTLRGASTQYTVVSRPQVDGLNHNIVFEIDSKRSYILERIDAENAGNYMNSMSYRQPQSRIYLSERSLVEQSTEPSGNTTSTNYATDGSGNPLVITDAANRDTEATWGNVAGELNLTPMATLKKPGINTAIQYSSFTDSGKAQTTIDSRGNSSSRVYNGSTDLLTSATDAENNTTTMAYDGDGYLTTLTDAQNNQTSSTYDALGRIKTTISPLGLATTYNYDNNGNIISMVEQGSGHTYTTTYHYDAAGNMDYSIDPKGFRTDYTYDVMGRKTTETYTIAGSGTFAKSYTYDAIGRMTTSTNERNQTTDTNYTVRSKIASVVNPLSEMVSYTYDDNGNVESITDGEGHTIIKTYDNLNRVTKITDDNNNFEEYTYTTAGFVDTYRNKNGVVTKYTYDNNGNQLSLSYVGHPELGTVYSTYDKNNNLKTVTDAEGHISTYTYDSLNQLVELKDHNNRKWLYTYDANGNQLTETMPDGENTVSTYDAFNRLTNHKEYSSASSLLRQISYTYDANGNVTSKTNGSSTLSYTYDELNRIKTATGHYGQTIGYQYDGVGNITKIIYPGSNKDVDYTYDNADRMKTVTDWLGNTTTYVTRNEAGQIKNVTLGNNSRIIKDYDAAGRLTLLENKKSNGTVISSHTMTLDDVGNITNAVTTLPLSPQLELGTVMNYDNTNRILSNGGDSYTHDLNGRITQNTQSGDNIVYNFNTNDLITQIDTNGSTTSQYSYSISDNRVSSILDGVETRYVIDENSGLPNVLAETNASGVVQRYYIYGDEGLLEQIDSANNVKFYHYDPTGNTLALTDGAQSITDSYAYSPYGTLSKDGATANPFLYSGKHGVMDDGNGLNYMRARFYKPDIKRFMSLDALLGSIGNPQSLNRYAYVLGNPIMGVDPSGYCYNSSGAGSLAIVPSYKDNHCEPQINDFSNPILNATYDVSVAIGSKVWNEAVYKPADNIVNGYKNANGIGYVGATLNVPYQMMIGVGNALPLGAAVNAGKASVELGVNSSGLDQDKKEEYIGLYNNTIDTIAVVNTLKSGLKKGGDFSKDKSYDSLKTSNAEIRRYFASGKGLRADELRLWRDSLRQDYRKLMYINIENLSDGVGMLNYTLEKVK